jgi:selenide, water dikinase
MRFIDLAAHAGCSKKGAAKEIRDLLSAVHDASSGKQLEFVSKHFPDCGTYVVNGQTFLSTVDIVLPMTLSATDFGKIAVCHVLSDLYASGGIPLFALCILGVPSGMSASSDEAIQVMTAAVEALSSENVLLVGGHTMTDQQDFYLGFAAIGQPICEIPFDQGHAQTGDVLVLTKPLGTSIATLRWKLEEASEAEHRDVIDGMLQSNREAANIIAKHKVHACTDVTGYGLLGHLYNILNASGIAARINVSKLPRYKSIAGVSNPDQSRQAIHNVDYIRPHLKLSFQLSSLDEALLFDSQVSGGLLFCTNRADAMQICKEFRQAGLTSTCVGEIVEGPAGEIELRK